MERPEDYPIVASPRVRRQVLAAADWRCVLCGSHRDMQVDHIVPRALGGRANPSNLRALCGKCNGRKRARVVDGREMEPPSPVVALRLTEEQRARLMEWGATVREAVLALLDAVEGVTAEAERPKV